MGLFSSKKKTYVSSVSYPLGEDDEDRVDYLQYTVLNATLQNRSVGEAITQGYLRGQGMALRNAFKYARDHYAHGVPRSAAVYLDQPDTTLITPLVQPNHPGAEILYLTTVVGSADYEWWAEQYLAREFGYDRVLQEFIRPPAGVDADAAVAYDLEPSGLVRILLMNAGGATQVIDFRPADYVGMVPHLHCAYRARTVFTEKDETVSRPATPGEIDTVQVQTTIVERIGESQERTVRIDTDVEGGTAVVRTRITVVVTTRPQYLLYRLGAGTYPSIDAWLQDDDLLSPYYPTIPLRVDNVDMLSDAKKSTALYKTSKKLLKRVGADIDKIGKQINENPSIRDIDFAFITFGVALNTKSQEGKRYLYRYFEMLRGMSSTPSSPTKITFDNWVQALQAGTTTAAPKINAVEVYSAKERAKNHDIKIQWNYIDTQLKSGVIFPGAKPGDVDISMSGVRTEFNLFSMNVTVDNSKLYARRQVDVDTYEELEIGGLVHENFIYAGKSVTVTAYEAFHDLDEEGFIVPLNQQIVRATPIVELTDLSYQCLHLVFNCYKVVKTRWYQRGIFKVILVIVAILIVFFTWGAGTPISIGLLGMTIVVAGALMVLLAATLYVLALMVIMNILMKASVAVFGDKWGPVIAAIAGMFVGDLTGFSVTAAGTSAAVATSSTLLTAQNIMNASATVLNAYGGYAQYQIQDVMKSMEKLKADYEVKMDLLEDLTKANLGTSADLIDIEGFTLATRLQFESADTFLGRTLLTGSDICEITTGLVENFADVGLRLPTTG